MIIEILIFALKKLEIKSSEDSNEMKKITIEYSQKIDDISYLADSEAKINRDN
ncbi:MAG: hypothetical protein R3E95_10310 [Thiolinea sp.]